MSTRHRLLWLVVAIVTLVGGGHAIRARQTPPAGVPAGPAIAFSAESSAPAEPLSLWYRRPASDHPLAPPTPRQSGPAASAEWTQALPIGNGRLGAMIFGGVVHERLQLNEDTLWAGGPYNPVNPEAKAALPEVRRLIFDGKYKDAANLVAKSVMAKPLKQMPYETVGDLALTFPTVAAVEGYRRDLNLSTAIAHVEYVAGGVRFEREAFSSAPDQVIVVNLRANRPGQISFEARLQTPQRATVVADPSGVLTMTGTNGDGGASTADGQPIRAALKFQARVRVVAHGGTTTADGDAVVVRGADSATLFIAAATSYRSYRDVSGDPEQLTQTAIARASAKSVNALRDAHVRDHQRLFNRVALNLGRTDAAAQPTDARIRGFATGHDPDLAALYFQFGRYLLVSSSRPGTQAANLQGLWNDTMDPPWGSKYTININTEMNYWPASSTNLDECLDPLADLVLDLVQTGGRMAQEMYGARGWVTHHNTDLWRATGPVDGPQWGMWPTGGAWLTVELWDRYRYTGDRDFARKIYPALSGAAQFFVDTLVEEPTHHWLVTSPSLSPENSHPFGTSLVDGPTMDQQILRELFDDAIDAAELLGVDADLRAQWKATRARLAPMQIGKNGQLQEWLQDWDMQAPEIHHRHVSHLYGLFPGREIDVRKTPELANAVKRSLEIRGDQATGWATAWRINLWTRLADGDHAYEILKFLLSPERTYPDMFDAHPPFQIDGNFGGTAAIAEMLLQSQNDEVQLLPALPKAWPGGSVSGLRARGGFDVSLSWKDGALERATIVSRLGRPLHVRRGDVVKTVQTSAGRTYTFTGDALR
jgi:alpha-L-fucosidase 2